MDQNTSLSEFIFVAKDIIPNSICKKILDDTIKANTWVQGNWYNYAKDSRTPNTHSTSLIPGLNESGLIDYISEARIIYSDSVLIPSKAILPVGRVTNPFMNRYEKGQFMERHVDHINSIFDGKQKGIPTMTSIGILNDDFEGGEFVLYDDLVIDLKVGDILLFPSIFLYPHRVNEVTEGTRYSWISWWF